MKPLALSVFLLFVASFQLGCGPTAPSEAEARASFEADREAIRAFDDGVRRHIAAEGLLAVAAEDDSHFHEKSTLMRRARATFREIGLPDFTRQAGALRAEIRLLDGDSDTGLLAGAGASPPVRETGTRSAEEGVEVSGHQLGWGVYGIEDSNGVLESTRGYEVLWEVELEERRLGVRLFMPVPAAP